MTHPHATAAPDCTRPAVARAAGLLLVATVALSLAACNAGPRNPSTWQGAERHFREMDKNDDDKLTPEELNPELALYQEFTRYDVDATGAIELDEFYDYVRAREGMD